MIYQIKFDWEYSTTFEKTQSPPPHFSCRKYFEGITTTYSYHSCQIIGPKLLGHFSKPICTIHALFFIIL